MCPLAHGMMLTSVVPTGVICDPTRLQRDSRAGPGSGCAEGMSPPVRSLDALVSPLTGSQQPVCLPVQPHPSTDQCPRRSLPTPTHLCCGPHCFLRSSRLPPGHAAHPAASCRVGAGCRVLRGCALCGGLQSAVPCAAPEPRAPQGWAWRLQGR